MDRAPPSLDPDHAYIVAQLQDAGAGEWEGIAKKVGIPKDTLIKIARCYTINPSWRAMRPLLKFYKRI